MLKARLAFIVIILFGTPEMAMHCFAKYNNMLYAKYQGLQTSNFKRGTRLRINCVHEIFGTW